MRVVAVTKGFGDWAIEAAVAAGCRLIGENYAQELVAKRDGDRAAGAGGALHRPAADEQGQQLVAGLVDVWASLDRPSLVDEVAKRAPGARVLIQVDTTGDPAKGGCPLGDVAALVERARDAGLVVDGLMTVGPDGGAGRGRTRRASARCGTSSTSSGSTVCSMGMSGDLEVAVQEGSTEVRIGTALFGPRPPRR